MDGLWKLHVVLGAAAAIGAWLLLAMGLRRRRLAGLRPVADDLGLVFHGTSFRGRFMGHAVRGDGASVTPRPGGIPRQEAPAPRSLGGLFVAPFAVGRTAVRLRVELTSQTLSRPASQRAAAAARNELKDRGVDQALYEVSLRGTELIFVLRDGAVTAGTARAVVEKALRAAKDA